MSYFNGANTFQFFTRNPRGGSAKALDLKDVQAMNDYCAAHGIRRLPAHAPYTLNACAKDEKLRCFAKDTMVDDLKRLKASGSMGGEPASEKRKEYILDKYEVLSTYFGYSAFREGQEELIDGILGGRDVLGIMPTGAGKSICYQVPALVMPGITLVVSPLISLMMDQVKALNQAGVHAAYINSSLTENQIARALQLAATGQYKIIYVAPERLETERFLRFAMEAPIDMLTVDEAHCISQWGQDFRPSYLKILQFIDALPRRPIISAFTATATTTVKDDIVRILKLRDTKVLVTGFDRQNLFFEVRTGKRKEEQLYHYLQNHPEESGIIYCATRKNVEKVWEYLNMRGLPVAKYHAGLTPEERKANQEDFIYDRKSIVVATNAFGMGIDKSNVRYVLHYNMPQSMENYYQEAGRAGRDGAAAECVIFYSPQDVVINNFLLENKNENSELPAEQLRILKKNDQDRLRAMAGYCKTTYCLRQYILRYFGTCRYRDISGEYCGNCGNCVKAAEHKDYDRYGMGDLWEDEALETESTPWQEEPSKLDDTRRESARRRGKKQTYGTGVYGEKEQELFVLLKAKRLELARQKGLPPYMIFSDKTLLDMCSRMPGTREEMLEVNGVGENKFGRYGEDFLECIREYRQSKE